VIFEKGFNAAANLSPYQLVVLAPGDSTSVVAAGAGSSPIGVTQNEAAQGNGIGVRLLGSNATCKVQAAKGIAAGAVVYAAANGQVSDAVVGNPIGEVLDAASGAGSIVEMLPSSGGSGQISPDAVVNDAANEGAVPIVLHAVCTPDAGLDPITIATPDRKLLIVDAWVIARDTTAANITIANAGTMITTAVVAKGVTANAIVRVPSLVAAAQSVAPGAAITATFSAQANADVYLLCIPTA
jgi:hypothetical protein